MKTTKAYTNQEGFTLVELAIVLIISGLMLSVVGVTYKYYGMGVIEEDTEENIALSREAVGAAAIFYGRYPCPADPTLPVGHINYGKEDRLASGECNTANLEIVSLEGRDVDGDGNGEVVLVGALPFQYFIDPNNDGEEDDAIIEEYTVKDGFDGWGRKLTYAVTLNLTDLATYSENGGAIDIVDKGIFADQEEASLLDKPGSAHYLILSHGPNGTGAYNDQGKQIGGCVRSGVITPPDPDAPPLYGRDDEIDNCYFIAGGEATFLSSVKNDSANDYYDDYITYHVSKKTSLWEYLGSIPGDGGTRIYQIVNTNPGRIALGDVASEDREQFSVDGDLQANQVFANSLCDEDGNEDTCMSPTLIGGEEETMQCPSGQVITSISNSSVQCGSPFPDATWGECPAGTYLRGVSSTRGLICETI